MSLNCCCNDMMLMNMIRNNIKEICQHGEAASVNLESVKQERLRIAQRLEKFKPGDQLNLDKLGLFGL